MKKYLVIAFAGLQALRCLAGSDLLIGVTDSPDPVVENDNLTYSIAVSNAGPDTATNVIVTDVIPASAVFVSCSPSQGSYTQEGDVVTCSLSNLANGATARVVIVVSPTEAGSITNEVSVTGDTETGNNRASAVTTVQAENHPPLITITPSGPFTLPVGSTTSFVVTATDDQHPPTLTNPVKPSGGVFDGTNFTWTAPASATNTTNLVVFVADDEQGATNSVVTNSTTIIVPFDWDDDGLGDGWEWTSFGSLTNEPSGDFDGDGADNYFEYVSGTDAADVDSHFALSGVVTPAGQLNSHQVTVPTVPRRKYTIYYDDALNAGASWTSFANTNYGVWIETALAPTNHTFVDDEGANTTGGPPAMGGRAYRIEVAVP